MLKDKSSAAIVAVKDLKAGRAFYADVLGLPLIDDGMGTLTFGTGATRLLVYESEYAGTNQANAVVWGVGDDLEAIVTELKGRGVTFEHYDMPDTTFRDGIHHMGDFRAAWFKDPDGNILHINSAN